MNTENDGDVLKHVPLVSNKQKKMVSTFSELINEYAFFIPAYQRAYCWTEKQISLFIADIAEHAANEEQPEYYLGHYILEGDSNEQMAIVDGQQRLTTVAIFLSVCQLFKTSPTPLPRLRLNVVKYDDDRFKELLLVENLKALVSPENVNDEKTASLKRVVKAIRLFYDSFQSANQQPKQPLLSRDKIDAYLDVINKAAVSVGIYERKAVASQIFELHNTRGVLLTETEKVKALLMKYVYLYSEDKNRDVDSIQQSFASVFQLEEQAAHVSFRGEMTLDDILMHHMRSIEDGKDKDSFTEPLSVDGDRGCLASVRKRLNDFGDKRSLGIEYAKALASELAKSMVLVSEVFVDLDRKEPLIGDLILLDQRRSMIFLLRYLRVLPTDLIAFHTLLKRWESFLFLWDWHDAFFNMKSSWKDSFPQIFKLIFTNRDEVATLLKKFYSGEENFANWPFKCQSKGTNGENIVIIGLAGVFRDYLSRNKDNLLHGAYNWRQWHGRYKYLLYKYEIECESSNGNWDQTNNVRMSLRNLFKENDVTLDHIVPHELEWKDLSLEGEQSNELGKWVHLHDRKQAEENWREICKVIEGLGNLVLLSRSINANLRNCAPLIRAAGYEDWHLLSQSYREVKNWKDARDWKNKIEERGKDLLSWMDGYFANAHTWPDNKPKIKECP